MMKINKIRRREKLGGSIDHIDKLHKLINDNKIYWIMVTIDQKSGSCHYHAVAIF